MATKIYLNEYEAIVFEGDTTETVPAGTLIMATNNVRIRFTYAATGKIYKDYALTEIQDEDGVVYEDYAALELALGNAFSVSSFPWGFPTMSYLAQNYEPIQSFSGKSINIDGNRTDEYTADGSAQRPYKTFSEAIAIMEVGERYAIYVAPADYIEAEAAEFPASPFVLYGNGATLTIPEVTVNERHAIYDLNTVGVVNYDYSGTSRSVRQGGSINGAVNISGGFPHFENLNYTGVMTITDGHPYFRGLTGGGRIVLNGAAVILSVSDINMDNNLAVSNITVTAGQLIVNGGILKNDGTVPNIALNNTNLITAAHAFSGLLAPYVTCGNAYTLLAPDCVIPAITGTLILPTQPSMFATGIGSGTAQAQIATVPMTAVGLFTGLRVTYFASASNTDTAPTVNVNGFGEKTIIRGAGAVATSSALVANDILIGMPVDILYNGTDWLLMNPQTL